MVNVMIDEIGGHIEGWFTTQYEALGLELNDRYHPGWHPLYATPFSFDQEPIALKWNSVFATWPLPAHYDKDLPWKPLYAARFIPEPVGDSLYIARAVRKFVDFIVRPSVGEQERSEATLKIISR